MVAWIALRREVCGSLPDATLMATSWYYYCIIRIADWKAVSDFGFAQHETGQLMRDASCVHDGLLGRDCLDS
jgi:hypothetical protein